MLVNDYFYFDSVLSDEECDKVIKLGDSFEEKATVNLEDEWKEHSKLRKTDITFVENPSIYEFINPFLIRANEESGWKFEINGCEMLQIARYSEGQYYGWHRDGTCDTLSVYNEEGTSEFLLGNVRKISMSILLNDDYEGGELEFSLLNIKGDGTHYVNEFKTPPIGKGSIVFFPSFLAHRVTPVTKGERYSLVAWFLGPPFK
jgi:PKHD-type hydroxylase